MSKRGFTLLEMLLAMALSSGLLLATTAFYAPAIKNFQNSTDSNFMRIKLNNPLESIGNDVEHARAVYVDTSLCYATCMVDTTGANRIYYYWGSGSNAGTLYRKKESVSTAIACTGGKAVGEGLDPAQSSFSIKKDLLSVGLSAVGTDGAHLKVHSVFFPVIQERDYVLSEGFECKTLKDGWIITLGTGRTNWSIVPSTQNLGNYEISDSDISSGTDTTSIEIPIDLSRLSAAHLSFNYKNAGTITANDSFQALLWDGTTWQTVFTDVSHSAVTLSKPVQVDLTPYSLNTNNRIKFTSTLSTAGAHWYVDQIQVYTP